jgi:tetratricopeptide (TPR) repeat protein
MIVRDNAGTLGACLESIRPWVDEMVVVDTGSTDDTPQIAERLGARVYRFPWCDSFAAARNESLRHARGRWVFWMDSDDTIDPDNGRKLRDLVAGEPDPSVLGFVMQVHCPGPGEEGQDEVTVVDHVKLFRNRPDLRFERRIHEQIIPAIRRAGGEIAWTDLFVVHSGYDHSPRGQERKKERDLRLLHLELGEDPEHPFTLFNLGMTYQDVGRAEEAVGFLRRCIARSGPGESHLRKAYAYLVSCQRRLGRAGDAWQSLEEGLALFPRDAELLFLKAGLLQDAGRLEEAVQAYWHLLATDEERHYSSVVRGIRGHLARQNLALACEALGDLARAEEQWRLIVAEVPRYRAGWRGLGDVLLRQDKHREALQVAEQLPGEPTLQTECLVLQGRVAAARGDLTGARRALERAAAGRPDDVHAWQALCQFLFEYVDPAEAEGPLKELLRCDPEDASAHHNLGTVYLRKGELTAAAEAFRHSLRLRPASAVTWLQLGHALRAGGRTGEAADAFAQALRLSPGSAEAADALRQLRQPVAG